MALCLYCEGQEHSGSCDREALKAVIRRLREELRVSRAELMATKKLPGDNVIFIQSLISHRNQKPRIDIQIGEIHTQMSADAAVNIAKQIIHVAAGSFADAFVFHFLKEKLNQPDETGLRIIGEFRDYRMALEEEFQREQQMEGSDL